MEQRSNAAIFLTPLCPIQRPFLAWPALLPVSDRTFYQPPHPRLNVGNRLRRFGAHLVRPQPTSPLPPRACAASSGNINPGLRPTHLAWLERIGFRPSRRHDRRADSRRRRGPSALDRTVSSLSDHVHRRLRSLPLVSATDVYRRLGHRCTRGAGCRLHHRPRLLLAPLRRPFIWSFCGRPNLPWRTLPRSARRRQSHHL